MKRLRLTVHRHLARTAAFEWPKFLRDPRRRRGRRYSFSTLMNALWAGVLTATANLRRLENFTERLGRRISDTTLHRILVSLSPKALRQKLIGEVRAAVRAKEIEHDLPFSLCAIDGKAICCRPAGHRRADAVSASRSLTLGIHSGAAAAGDHFGLQCDSASRPSKSVGIAPSPVPSAFHNVGRTSGAT